MRLIIEKPGQLSKTQISDIQDEMDKESNLDQLALNIRRKMSVVRGKKFLLLGAIGRAGSHIYIHNMLDERIAIIVSTIV